MKAIIEKQVSILPANSGFVSKSDINVAPYVLTIRLFSIPIYRKEVNASKCTLQIYTPHFYVI